MYATKALLNAHQDHWEGCLQKIPTYWDGSELFCPQSERTPQKGEQKDNFLGLVVARNVIRRFSPKRDFKSTRLIAAKKA